MGADVPSSRVDFGVAVVNDLLYVIGGHLCSILGLLSSSSLNEQYTPIGYGTVPPVVHVVSPESKNYTSSNVSLAFTVNKPALWMGFSLDGSENVTLTGNTTLTSLGSGVHNIRIYAKDEFQNTGASETITFKIMEEATTQSHEESETPTATLIAAASASSATLIGLGILIHFKRRNR